MLIILLCRIYFRCSTDASVFILSDSAIGMDDRQHHIQQILHQATASSASAWMQSQTSPHLLGNVHPERVSFVLALCNLVI